MSVRNSLLTILTMGPCYGAQLKAEFERRTGGAWPLNVGQVYTTLARLERDGLVARSAPDEGGLERFEITHAGRAEATGWLHSTSPAGSAPRDEFVMKAVIGLTVPGVDTAALLEAQEHAASVALERHDEDERGQAGIVAAARREQLAAQLRWIAWLRSATPAEPWGLDGSLPKRGRPAQNAANA